MHQVKFFYYRENSGNFGDALNEFFFQSILGQPAETLYARKPIRLVGIGTLVNEKLPRDEHVNLLVGSGAGLGNEYKVKSDTFVHFVRGPLTASTIGVDESLGICDPAYALPSMLDISAYKKYGIGFLPHYHTHYILRYEIICQALGMTYISPVFDFRQVINLISRCRLLLTESLHGAILADALRVPWLPLVITLQNQDFKWRDWCACIQREYSPVHIRQLSPGRRGLFDFKTTLKSLLEIRRIAKKAALLSDNSVHFSKKEEVKMKLADLPRILKVL